MRVVSLTPENVKEVAEEAAHIIRNGGVVLYPTDTLYGLGADALSNEAVDKIYAIKGRDPKKPMHAIVSDLSMVEKYAEVTEQTRCLVARFWPGPLTLVLKKKTEFKTGIARDMDTIGVRAPHNEFCLAMVKAFGSPITTTSANTAGATPAFRPADILSQLASGVQYIDLVIDTGQLPESKPSTVVDLSSELKILREGVLSTTEINAVLGK